MAKMKDLTGKRFGTLTAIMPTNQRSKNGRVLWLCKCDCNEERIVPSDNLLHGFVKSCRSCAVKHVREANKLRPKKPKYPGKWLSNERLYRIWKNMINRCYYPRCIGYKYYGGKGVIVCSEWKNSFPSFKKWAQDNGYKESLTIDRIDGNGNYTPENCRWITPREQTYNMSNNIYIVFQNKKIALSRLIFDFGLNRQQVYDYLRNLDV